MRIIAGETYTIKGPIPPAGRSFNYQWSVTDGSPKTSGEASFRWTAPLVFKPEEVEVSLLVSDTSGGCTNQSSMKLLVIPKDGAKISIKKDCIFSPPVHVGDSVVYTYNVTNTGSVALKDVSIEDVHNWGPNCQPYLVRGDDGDQILGPGESWWYECRYMVPDPTDYPRLYTMAEKDSYSKTVAIIGKLTDMKIRLEILMDNLRRMQKAFDEKAAVVTTENRKLNELNYAFTNYTNEVTGEGLSIISLRTTGDNKDHLNSTVYFDPISGAILVTRYDLIGRIIYEEIRSTHTKESLIIEYGIPSQGYRTYTVCDYDTGDTLILVLDPEGSVLRMEYRKTPGYRPYEERFFLKNTATVKASDATGLEVSDSDSFTLEIFKLLPILRVTKVASPDPVNPGAVLNYSITYENLGGDDAHDVIIQEIYDKSLEFLWSDQPPDFGTTNRWTVGDLRKGESGTVKIMMKVSSTVSTEDIIRNRVDLTCKENSSAEALINTTVTGNGLGITKTASSEIIGVGDYFTYIINYKNYGRRKESNAIIHDYFDPRVDFISYQANPPLSSGSFGRDRWWFAGDLEPGGGGTIEILAKAKPKSYFADGTTIVYNTYNINSSQSYAVNKTLENYIVHSLWITKTANKTAVKRDEDLTYTIRYGNSEKRIDDSNNIMDARNVYIVDVLPDVEVLSISPPPTSINGNVLTWFLPVLRAEENGSINIDVHIPKLPNMDFTESSSVKGEGYVYVRKGLSTAEDKPALTNNVRIWGYYGSVKSNATALATVTLIGAAGTRISTFEHGSGYYEEAAQSRLRTENKSISFEKGIFAKHKKTSFSLPGKRNITYESLWSDRTTAENRILNEEVSENYMYTDTLSKNSTFQVDMNQTVYTSESEFNGGLAQVDYERHDGNRQKTVSEISEEYHGSFKVLESVDSYGGSLKYSKSSKGKGFVSSDKRPNELQRSFEHGSGYYNSEETLQGDSISKDSKMQYASLSQIAGTRNLSFASLWKEGMITSDPGQGLHISEEIRYASKIEKEGVMERSSISLLSGFNGTMDIKVAREPYPKIDKHLLDQRFEGNFKIGTALSVHAVPKYLYPHVSVRKKARMVGENSVLFLINVTNDGNKPLRAVNVSDRLPDGLVFINSSIRPEISGQTINWSVPSLDISRTLTIKLNARIDDITRIYINTVNANAICGEQVVHADSSTMIDPSKGYLPCCIGINGSIKALGIFNVTKSDGYWQDWRPGSCLNATSEVTDCFKDIDEYYNELDRTEGTDKARSSYDIP